MPIAQDLRTGLIASVLLCAAATSAALTLGRSNGVPLIGRPLDVTIPVILDGNSRAEDLCPVAEVLMGESRVEAARVTVRVEPGAAGNAVVRIRTSRPVDEPVVTITLRLACTQQITRQYVLLSEQPAEIGAVAGLAPAPAPAVAAAGTSARGQAEGGASSGTPGVPAATGRGPSTASRGPASRAADGEERAAPRSSRGAAAARAERALPQRGSNRNRVTSRLQMDLLDGLPAGDPQLRSSSELVTAPTTSDQVRAQAAALWRALNAQPEDLLRDLQRVQALENDLQGLRGLVAANDRTLLALREELDQARQQRTLTLAVIALLVLLLSAGAVTWWLRRGDRSGNAQWWSGRGAAASRAGADAGAAGRIMDVDLQVDESMFKSLKESPPIYPPVRDKVPGKGPQASAPSPPRATAAAAPAAADGASASGFHSGFHSSFQGSQAASMRMVKAEELVDIQQQADFFMSLGQTDQAVEVLENHIRDNVETSALVWLDLLAIYRALKRPADYEALRSEFHRVFNAEVPPYDATPTVSGGLEDYPRALTRIAALWPSPKVMEVIEESIFRRPGGDAEPFDLEAYRELVMLYNVGREVVQPDDGAPEGWVDPQAETASPYVTAMQPLSVARDSAQSEDVSLDSLRDADESALLAEPLDLTGLDEMLDPKMPRPSPRLGLDIDLSAEPAVAGPPPAATVPDNSIDFELADPDPGSKPQPQLEPDENKGDEAKRDGPNEPDPKTQ